MAPYFIAERISLSELCPCLVTSTHDATLRKLGITPEAQASLHCEKKKNSKTMIYKPVCDSKDYSAILNSG